MCVLFPKRIAVSLFASALLASAASNTVFAGGGLSKCELMSKADPNFNSATVGEIYKIQIPYLGRLIAHFDRLKQSKEPNKGKDLKVLVGDIETAKWDTTCAIEKLTKNENQLTLEQRKIFRGVLKRLRDFKTGKPIR